MGRWTLNILAGTSALLFVAVAVLWVRSYWVTEWYSWVADGEATSTAVVNAKGRLAVSHINWTASVFAFAELRTALVPPPGYMAERPPTRLQWDVDPAPDTHAVRLLGLVVLCQTKPGQSGSANSVLDLLIPHYWLLLLCLPMPLLWLRCERGERRLRWRRETGLCLTCGYDLRASIDRCPECGSPIPATTLRRPLNDYEIRRSSSWRECRCGTMGGERRLAARDWRIPVILDIDEPTGRPKRHPLKCVGRDGVERMFEYDWTPSVCRDNGWDFSVYSPEVNDSFQLTVVPRDEHSVRITEMVNNGHKGFSAVGIPDALIPAVARVSGKNVTSSSNKHKSADDEFRNTAADKVWERLVARNLAYYDADRDIYVLK